MAAKKSGIFIACGLDILIDEQRYYVSVYGINNTFVVRKHCTPLRTYNIKITTGWEKLSLLDLITAITIAMEEQGNILL
jgi:hypothetical protein